MPSFGLPDNDDNELCIWHSLDSSLIISLHLVQSCAENLHLCGQSLYQSVLMIFLQCFDTVGSVF